MYRRVTEWVRHFEVPEGQALLYLGLMVEELKEVTDAFIDGNREREELVDLLWVTFGFMYLRGITPQDLEKAFENIEWRNWAKKSDKETAERYLDYELNGNGSLHQLRCGDWIVLKRNGKIAKNYEKYENQ